MATTSSSRRIGTADSKTRAQLVAAAEQLLVEDGYAAVTSRRVAAAAGLKPQLVHYYFRTMDDLFLEVFRRRADQNLQRLQRLVSAGASLRALWQINSDPRGSAFMIEFAALANHRKAIRAEIASYADRWRNLQLDAIAAAFEANAISDDQMPPVAALLLMTGLSQVMAIEKALGVTSGHDTTVEFIDRAITRIETEQ